MNLIRKTIMIREDQELELLKRAAQRQLKTENYVSLSDVARDVIDAGLAVLKERVSDAV